MKKYLLAAGLLVGMMAGLAELDQACPPNVSRSRSAALVLLDNQGRLLDGRTSRDGAWRLPTTRADVDPAYVALLLRTEDRRFADHPGIDPLALLRAVYQLAVRRHIVSGGSTLAMQAARLLSPHRHTFVGKVKDILRALQLEARFGRAGVLDIYLTLAPVGGNIEGIRAASLLYLGHEPSHLSVREAALLVALPQRPEALRPDRHPGAALAGAERLLARSGVPSDMKPDTIARQKMPHDAPALLGYEWALGRRGIVGTTIDGELQRTATRIIRSMVPPTRGEFAALVVRHDSTAAVWIDGAGGDCPGCSVDLVTARRSPGSVLKPFAYGMAFDDGIITPTTIVRDERMGFSGYVPRNYDHLFHGATTATIALQQSYNLPAVQVLRRIGPARFISTLAACGVRLALPRGDTAPGLPVILGGAAIRMIDVVALYNALENEGIVRPVQVETGPQGDGVRLIRQRAAHQVTSILRGTPPPPGVPDWSSRRIAFKTGTSYGQRDAWAAGTTPAWTVVAWAGRPDGTASPGITGRGTAAPLMARLLDVLVQDTADHARPVTPLERMDGLSPALQWFGSNDGPRVVVPAPGSIVESSDSEGRMQPIGLEASGGTPPYRWMVNGSPIAVLAGGMPTWSPDGLGFAHIAVADAAGHASAVDVRAR